MEHLELTFASGVASPPQLGTVILKPAGEGKLSYAQNTTISNDKYGDGVVVPGPYINNSFSTSLTNPVYWKALVSQNVGGKNGQMWVGYNNGVTLDYIKNIDAGNIPAYETSGTVSLNITGQVPLLSDMVAAQWQKSTSTYVYATVNESTTTAAGAWVFAFQSSGTLSSPIPLTTITAAGGVPNPLPMIKTQFDGNIYIGNGSTIDKIDVSNTTFANGVHLAAIGASGSAIPIDFAITALGEWNGKLVAAASNEAPGDFSKRNGSGQSRIFFFDVAGNPAGNFLTNFVNSPSHYISVLFTDLSGNLLAFGGIDEGRTTIYQYNGYGFIPLFSYIGDMPRNRHSVSFDAQGRLMWMTVNGQVCRLNTTQLMAVSDEEQSGAFEHLGTISASGTGGILTNLQGNSNTDFVASGGANLSYINFSGGAFAGDGGQYGSMTPVVISGLQVFPQKSIIQEVTVSLNKALQSGESLDINYYPQGTTTLNGINLGNLSFLNDGSVASKQIRTFQTLVDEASFGAAWLTTNGTTTVPGLLKMDVGYQPISTL